MFLSNIKTFLALMFFIICVLCLNSIFVFNKGESSTFCYRNRFWLEKRADLISLTGCASSRNLPTKDDVLCFRFNSERLLKIVWSCFLEILESLSVETQPVYDVIALYQLIGRNFLECPFILYLFKFQSVHVKGAIYIFSFKFSVLYNTLSRK